MRRSSTASCTCSIANGIDVAEGEVLQARRALCPCPGDAPAERRCPESRVQWIPGASSAKMLQRAHIVQPVGQLDDDDANVRHHRQQHLANVFRLAVFAIGELDLVDLGDAFDDVRHLLAELLA